MTFIGKIGREDGSAAPGPLASDLEQRIEALLRTRLSKLRIPDDIRPLYARRVRGNVRKTTSAWCLWVGVLTILNSGFDFFLVHASLLPMVIAFRAILAGLFLLAAWLFRTEILLRLAPLYIGLPCVLSVLFAGIAGLTIHQAGSLPRYINDAVIVVATAIMFVGLDMRFCIAIAGLSLPMIAIFVQVSNIQPEAAKLQVVFFDACTILALIYGRHVQNLVLARMFLLNMRDELRNNEAKVRQEQLSSIAYTDPLTELPNRRYFDEICASMSEATKNLLPLSVCMIDVDHFKALNDKLGHLQGDRCLKLVGAAIRASLRSQSDIVARFGGEEFVLLLPGTDLNVAYEIAERVRAAIMELEHANPGSPIGVVTASVGVAEMARPPLALQTLLQNADHALYRAKLSGRNRVST